MNWRPLSGLAALGAATGCLASPTGLNIIPTTDIVPLSSWVAALQNGNTSWSGVSLFSHPQLAFQTQFGLTPWLEAGLDYAQTPDLSDNTEVFNVKALLMTENPWQPNVAVGWLNVATHQKPGYYVTVSKTLNYDQEQAERFRAHHRRNRKVLGRRVHMGLMLDGHEVYQPFFGTDLQLTDSSVFQADWTHGAGNFASAGWAYVLSDQRTVINPALLFSNDSRRFSGISINFNHQFNL